jgi:hypothetical protein
MPQLPESYTNWLTECELRKHYIQGLKVELKRRIALRNTHMAQWKEYIAEARNAVHEAESYPAPRRPM